MLLWKQKKNHDLCYGNRRGSFMGAYKRNFCRVEKRAGFAIAPILYLLTLIGVASGVLFSSYSQILRTNINITNTTTAKNDLAGVSATLAATAVLSADQTLFCPPGSSTPTVECAASPQKMVLFADLSGDDLTRLPTNYAAAETGTPTDIGVFAAGSGAKVLDPWGRYYIYCRWENARSAGSSPAMAVISAGMNAKIETGCADTTPSGDDQIMAVTVGSAIQRAALWQANGTDDVSYGATGTKVKISADGTITAKDLTLSGNASFAAMALTAPLPVASGGTGASTASVARLNLGSSTIGDDLFISASAAAARTTLGGTAVGQYLFSASTYVPATASTARSTLLGAGALGDSLFMADTDATARTILGAGALGDTLFLAGDVDTALTALGAGSVGKTIFVAADVDTALTVLGAGVVGKDLFTAGHSASALNTLGVGAVGEPLFRSATQAEAWAALGLTGGTGSLDVNISGSATSVPASGIVGVIAVSQGGTGSTTASAALNSLFGSDGSPSTALNAARIGNKSIASDKLTDVVTAGTYGSVTVDSAGRVTAGTTGSAGDSISDEQGDGILATATGGGYLYFSTANNINMTLNPLGYLGIGTQNPTQKLHVQDGNIKIAGPAATARQLQFATGANSLRWAIETNAVAESGTNAGSNFEILRYDDAGTTSVSALYLNRATGDAVFSGSVTATGGFIGDINGTTTLGLSALETSPRRPGEANTGLYSDASEAVSISTGGVEKLRADVLGIYNGTAQKLLKNTFLGAGALGVNVTGTNNTSLGYNSLFAGTGNYNTAYGANSGYSLTSGGYNTILGNEVASTLLTTGSRNILIGTSSTVTTPATDTNDFLNIGGIINADMANKRIGFNLGSTLPSYPFEIGTTTGDGNGAHLSNSGVWASTSDRRVKENIHPISYGLDVLMKMQPVAYQMIGTHEKQIGFIAQDIEPLIPELVSISQTGRYGLSYGNISAVIVKAVQEMKRANDNQITLLLEENKALQQEVAALKATASIEGAKATRDLLLLVIRVGGGLGILLLLGLVGGGVALYRMRRAA